MLNFKSFEDSGELIFGPINIFVGPNNSGKSALLRAIYGAQLSLGDEHVRLGMNSASVSMRLNGVDPAMLGVQPEHPTSRGELVITKTRGQSQHLALAMRDQRMDLGGTTSATEPSNFIYPYLARRKAAHFDENVNISTTNAIRPDLGNLAAKVARLANPTHPHHDQYVEACEAVLGFVPSAVASVNGQKPGLSAGPFETIYIEELGEGVSNVLGLITQLCVADSKLLLVEEPENDIHPQALKALLHLIAASSAKNQFVVTTHSHIVVKHLGALSDTRIYSVRMRLEDNLPTSSVRLLESPHERLEALESLGYDLFDFDLPEGFLILEEASAERLIRDYFVPWFAPWLSRLRTISAGGVSKVEPTFEDFHRLFLFAHLEQRYAGRAWVIVDGDEIGRTVALRLRQRYADWEDGHFLTWEQPDFESYYPEPFQTEAKAVLGLSDRQAKRSGKQELLQRLLLWIDEDRDRAKSAFESSAAPVVTVLREIERVLLSRPTRTTESTATAEGG